MTHEEKLEFLNRKWKATLSNEYWSEVERLAKLKGITYNNQTHSLFNDNIRISLGTTLFFVKVVDKGYFLLYNEYRNKEQGENNDYY